MKLSGIQVVAPNHRTEFAPVVALQRDHARIGGPHIERMDKVKVSAVRCVAQNRGVALLGDSIPSHVRHFERGWQVESNHVTVEDPQPFVLAMLEAPLEQQLQTQADPQEWSSRVDEVANRRGQIAAPNFGHGVAERTDARQDKLVGLGDFGRIRADCCLAADSLDSFLDAPQDCPSGSRRS